MSHIREYINTFDFDIAFLWAFAGVVCLVRSGALLLVHLWV